MARIRSMKPEMRTSLVVASWKREIRLFFAYMWGYLDDHGRGIDNAHLIKADTFPLDDDITADVIDGWLDVIATSGPLCRYEVRGRRYIHAVSWTEHQRPQHPANSRIPMCPIDHHALMRDPTDPFGATGDIYGEPHDTLMSPSGEPHESLYKPLRATPEDHLNPSEATPKADTSPRGMPPAKDIHTPVDTTKPQVNPLTKPSRNPHENLVKTSRDPHALSREQGAGSREQATRTRARARRTERASPNERTGLAAAATFVSEHLGCPLDEATDVATRIDETRHPKNLAGLLRTMARTGDIAPFLDDARAARRDTDRAATLAAARTAPPCEHGKPGGNLPHPDSGKPICVECRRDSIRTPAA